MKFRWIVYVLTIGFILSCSNMKGSKNGHIILNENMLEAYQNFDKTLSLKRSPLLFDGGKSADNCNSYYDIFLKYNITETIHNQMVNSEYLICDALKIISESPGVSESINVSSMGNRLLSSLDLRTFPNSLNRIADENSHTLKSLFPHNVKANGAVAILDTEDWVITLEVVAVVYVNNNSTSDWVVQFSDESKSGNYRNYSSFVIHDSGKAEVLLAMPYP